MTALHEFFRRRRIRQLLHEARLARALERQLFLLTEVHSVRDVHVSLICDDVVPCGLYYVWVFSPRLGYVWVLYDCERHSVAVWKAHQVSGNLEAMERVT